MRRLIIILEINESSVTAFKAWFPSANIVAEGRSAAKLRLIDPIFLWTKETIHDQGRIGFNSRSGKVGLSNASHSMVSSVDASIKQRRKAWNVFFADAQ